MSIKGWPSINSRRGHTGLRAATCQVCCARWCTNRRTGTARMMRVERVVRLSPCCYSSRKRTDLPSLPCLVRGRSIGKPYWVVSSWPRKSYGQETKSSHRKRKQHAMVENGVHRLIMGLPQRDALAVLDDSILRYILPLRNILYHH